MERTLSKRSAPQDVPPVIQDGIRYEATHFDNPCGQNGGCVAAFDAQTGTQLWSLRLYSPRYDQGVERDVQEVFVKSLRIDGGRLVATTEDNTSFVIDPAARAVISAAGSDGGAHNP